MKRLILVVGAATDEELLAALRELGQDKRLERNGCIGVTSAGASFDYDVDTVDYENVSIAQIMDEIKSGAWGEPRE